MPTTTSKHFLGKRKTTSTDPVMPKTTSSALGRSAITGVDLISGEVVSSGAVRRRLRSNAYSALFTADRVERLEMIRQGLPAIQVDQVSEAIGFSKEKLFSTLRLPRATVNRKILAGERLSPELSERLLGLQTLIGQVEVMVAESGDSKGFSAREWLGQWLGQPCPALGNKLPMEFLDTVEGQTIVSRLLAQMQSGAYA